MRDDAGHKTEKRGLAAAARASQEYTLPARDTQRFDVDYPRWRVMPREAHAIEIDHLLGLGRIEFHSRCTFGSERRHLLGETAGVSGLLWKPAFWGGEADRPVAL